MRYYDINGKGISAKIELYKILGLKNDEKIYFS